MHKLVVLLFISSLAIAATVAFADDEQPPTVGRISLQAIVQMLQDNHRLRAALYTVTVERDKLLREKISHAADPCI